MACLLIVSHSVLKVMYAFYSMLNSINLSSSIVLVCVCVVVQGIVVNVDKEVSQDKILSLWPELIYFYTLPTQHLYLNTP